ncbi:MAG: efflux RND transporter permease subunit [Clostridium luticellarii]|jgi:hydrophobe/amphiphile efflux-1 (HAE1) family protein|uniref:Multidrug resistance protein MdtB n=1 Tax=Clostridium luticellarii TaxID=1691940 RepID=A0A2T0BJC0_9CLOT|nr:efflux RND transporter permease subunit [Clostridium luticellarii]MCI2039213.1 efflux RND transporter permease subunit [Clostridium luticellarii]PRR83984.1 Multidrug resistance protein MdtB [Clostridium luticellarii]
MFLTDVSLKRPVFATVIIIVLLTLGVVSYANLPVDQFPNVDTPTVSATITQAGASPDQIESKITKKVEDAVGQISGVQHINSTITEGVSNTVITFELDKSSAEALQDVKDKLSNIRGDLPKDINEPVVSKYDANAQPIVSLAVTGSMSSKEMSQLVDDDITKKLQTINGVGAVNTYGEQEREIHIKLDKEKMNSFNITISELTNSLSSDNIDVSSGKISDGDTEIGLRTNSAVKNVDDFLNVLVTTRNGSQIRLKDIAEAEDGSKERDSLSFYNGREAIGIDILKQSNSNTVQVADAVKKKLTDIEKNLPSGAKIELVRDNSASIRDSVQDVQKTLIEGCILAVVVVFVFLKNFVSTAIAGIAIPVSIISTFAMMKVMNFSLNTVSLMALSIAVGLLIDDAIVVIENIVRHLRMGKSAIQAAKDATSEIGLAVMATTFALVAVFVPIAMINGLVGKFLVQFGLTVAASVLVSLFVAFTAVPLLSSKYLKSEEKRIPVLGKFLEYFNKAFDKLADFYARGLKVALNHRILVIIIPLILLIGSLLLATKLNTGFIAAGDTGELDIEANLDSGSTLNNASKINNSMESIIKKNRNVKYIYSTVKADKVVLLVKISDKQKRKEGIDEIGAEMRKDLKNIPGIDLSVVVGGGFIPGKLVQYHIKGDDFTKLQKYALKAEKAMKNTPGAVDVSLSYKAGKPEVDFNVDRDKAADLGVSPTVISSTLSTLFNGTVVGQYETEKDRYDVRVELQDSDRNNLDSLNEIYVPSANKDKDMIPIDQVTKKVFTTSSSTINRYDKEREIQLTANYVEVSEGEFNKAFTSKLGSEAPVPGGIELSAGGIQEQMTEGMTGLVVALVMGVLFVFLVIAAQFESFIDPLAILLSLPLAIIGAILGLLVGNKELDMMSMIGVVMLMGLVTKNAILLIDFTKQNYSRGMDLKEALIEAGRTRLRPIIMTTLAMIFGMLPTALVNGSGSELRAPMAFAIIGGLITSTLLTLLFVPVVYTFLNDFKKKFRKKTT